MNLQSVLNSIFRKNGYILVSQVYSNSIFLRKLDSRFAFGFAVGRPPRQIFPSVSVGVLDRSVHALLTEIESTQHLGLYGLTFYRELVTNKELTSRETKETVYQQIIDKVEKYIQHFSEQDKKILDNIQFSIAANIRPDFFLPGVGEPIRLDIFPYKRLVSQMANGVFRSVDEIKCEIARIESDPSMDPLLEFRLSLLSRYLEFKVT